LGDSVDYTNSRLAQTLQVNPGMELAIGRHVNVNLNHFFERLATEGERIYLANLLQTRLIYNFNVRAFVRAIVQYTAIDRNTALYNEPTDSKTRMIFTQFLFSYKINPQTVLFLGYSDTGMGNQSIDVTKLNRTFFLKIGYAWLL
jgi:predicted transcriptional regulator of viral defense system